jgi:hypothetical protein
MYTAKSEPIDAEHGQSPIAPNCLGTKLPCLLWCNASSIADLVGERSADVGSVDQRHCDSRTGRASPALDYSGVEDHKAAESLT